MKSRIKKRTSPLQTVDEHKVCVSAKVEKNEISRKTKDSMEEEQLTSIQSRSKKKTKKKINKFKDEELNQKYELLPKKARKAPFGRCYFAIHRDSQNVVLIAMIFQKVFDQFVQGGRGEDELHKLMKAADPNLSGLREKIQCAGAVAVIMDISSYETPTPVTRAQQNGSSSSSSHSSTPSAASKQNDNPREITRPDMPIPNSESNIEIKMKKAKRSRKRIEEKESFSQNSKAGSTSSKRTTSTQQQREQEVTILKPSESVNVVKDVTETRSPETGNQVEAPESSWASWLMPWTTTTTIVTKPPTPTPASSLFEQASEREFYQADADSAGPYDNMKNHDQKKKKAIQSSYYQGEAWSVVSPGYSDCDVSSRPAPSILFSQDSEDVIERIQSQGYPDRSVVSRPAASPPSSTLKSATQDTAEGIQRIQSLENSLRDKIEQERSDDERDDGSISGEGGDFNNDNGDGDDERDERVEKEEKEEEPVNKRMDPEGSHQVDPTFSAKPKEAKAKNIDEPTKEDTRISIAAALETRRRKARRRDNHDESRNKNIQPKKRMPEKEEVSISKPKEVDAASDDEPAKKDTRATIVDGLETSGRKERRKENEPLDIQQEKRVPEKEEVPTSFSPPLEFFKVKRISNEESKKSPIVERDAVSTACTRDSRSVYSADYSSVLPYRLMRPRNLTFCKLITSLEFADCMPLGPYDYNVDYDEIFSEGDEEARNGWFRRHDTFYSGDSTSSS